MPFFIGPTELRYPTQIKTYLSLRINKVLFRVTLEGEIEKDGVQITDDDSALADMLRAWLLQSYGLKIRHPHQLN
jgi:hypothetical protein